MTPHLLVEVEDSVLIVIDVQTVFLEKLPPREGQLLLSRICWVIGVAHWLHVPILVTAEDIARLGSVAPHIAQVLPAETIVHNKMVFGLADDSVIFTAVEQTGRKTVVLLGLETDVCVAHSALGLLERGYRVVTIADATGSPDDAHIFGLERIRGAGGVILSVKSLFYEWVRTVARARRFHAECKGLGAPEGVRL